MAYRMRQQGISISKTSSSIFEDVTRNPNPFPVQPNDNVDDSALSLSSSSLATKAIRASSARRDYSLSSLYGLSASSPISPSQPTPTPPPSSKIWLLPIPWGQHCFLDVA